MKKHKKSPKVEQKESFGQLIDSPMDDFKAFMLRKDVGFVHSFSLLVESSFLQMVDLKNAYLEKLETDKLTKKEKIDLMDKIQKVYAELQVIEEKQTYLIELEKNLMN